MEHNPMDPEEEAYWNAQDEEEETQLKAGQPPAVVNGSSPTAKPLVDYPSDEEVDENGDTEMSAAALDEPAEAQKIDEPLTTVSPTVSPKGPPERLSEKRRREEEDDDDEMGKLMQNKRRNSSSAGLNAATGATGAPLRKKSSSFSGRDVSSNAAKKIAISISPVLKTAATTSAISDEDVS